MTTATDTEPRTYSRSTATQARAAVVHEPTCPGADVRTRPARDLGSCWAGCLACRAWTIQDGPVPAAAYRIGYACREHYQPVTWKGSGCRRCDAERRDAQRTRAEKRRLRRDALARSARRSDTPTE